VPKRRYYAQVTTVRLDSPRVIGLAACGLVLAGWLLGSTLSPPVASTQARAATRSAAAEAPAIVPLRALTAAVPRPSPPSPTRNPFAFGRAGHGDAALPEPEAAPTATPGGEAPIAAAAAPAWRLIGMATAADGTLTAVLGGAGAVTLARAGDALPDGVTVTAVADHAVTLTRADGTTIDLRLP